MIKLLAIFAIAMVFAHSSAKRERRSLRNWDYNQKIIKDSGYIIVVIALVLFAGLRISYNDTDTYTREFIYSTPSISEFAADPISRNIFKNPASEWYKVLLRNFTYSKTAYLLPPAILTEYSYLRLFKKYSVSFDFSVFLFFTLGTYCFTLGALKQSMAMGVLCYAIEAADRKKWIKFGLLVFIAMLFHTYAICFIVLPFLRAKPWSAFTFLMAAGAVVVFMNLETVLGSIADFASDQGKRVNADEIMGFGVGSNIFRVAVYAVPVVISFVFRKKIFYKSQPIENICVHLSILSFTCMAFGIVMDPNFADRMATYFVVGTVISFPLIIKKAFDKNMAKTVTGAAYVCFFFYFVYKFYISSSFDVDYQSILSRYIG